ncbi:D-alanine--D-alanine ligase [Myxococcus sp. NMCA1]|nr:D-alanine--D-alanine ligase [Myxococcus sp. NMCA1]WAM30411.1 D-alanine--D-alanine ligase [Myxococcus sp. NMCA1]
MSAERDVSLRTGEAVSGALRGLGYDVVEIDVGRDLPARLAAEKVDVAWLAVHGRYGEDGCLQGLLESLFIPYTGSGVLASALGMDKVYAKQVFVAHGIPTPAYRSFRDAASALAAADSLPFPFPVVVKPSREGSSVGVHICKTRDAYEAAVTDAAKYAGTLLVEQFVKGREVQGGVLDDEALGVIEVRAAREFYDYDAKYKAGTGTQYLFPAPLPPDQYARVNEVCLAAHQALGCSGGSRSDVIVTDGGEVFLLETNTLPGMTASSLLPKIAAGRGIDFPSLCERLLLGACLKA